MNEELLRRILQEELKGIKEDVNIMKQDISDLKATTDRIEERQKMIFNEVGGLMEFRTEAIQKIDKLADNIEFLFHKGSQTEQDVFYLKRKLL